MDTVNATEAKTHFGALIDRAQREPVTIQKQGRPVAVLVSFKTYNQQQQLSSESKQAALDFLNRWTEKPAPGDIAQKLKGDIQAQALWDKYNKA